ncbi:SCO family protein [Rugamonas sp.]|uniref:SCO family protein n=1 Tax=Rugamonas sp. TaxID=1926287 RepID=UPI0025E06B30|nr:SCO family protein [Rugamonas sp.]
MTTSTSSNNSAHSSNNAHHWPRLTLAAVLTVALLGFAAIYQATMGLNVVSTEDGRRLDVEREPRDMPFAAVHRAPPTTLAAMLRADRRVTVVAFIYTSCNSVCTVLGSEFQQMQQIIRQRNLQDKVRLLSISFDARDTAERLASYAERQHADPAIWKLVGIDSEPQRKAVLQTFGIVVLPAPLGEFVHNAAFHLVDSDGRLAKIDDFDMPSQALADAVDMFEAHRK